MTHAMILCDSCLHDRTGRLEKLGSLPRVIRHLHDRTGRLEKNLNNNPSFWLLHDRTGRLEK